MKKSLLSSVLFLLFLIATDLVQAQYITVTLAGTGMMGYTGDGGAAKKAKLNAPVFITSDRAGNIYFSNTTVIRKIASKTGIITTVGGGGTSIADGVPATSTALSILSICSDTAGNLYVGTVNKIRKIDAATNVITTFAGTGVTGFAGDGGPATNAQFNGIMGICIDKVGNISMTDRNNQRIRRIDGSTGIVTTSAGTGVIGYTGDGGPATAATLRHPTYICVSPEGDVYFTDQSEGRMRKINYVTNIISTIAGGGGTFFGCPPLSCALFPVSGICHDGGDNIYFNEWSCTLRRIDLVVDTVFAVAGIYWIGSFANDTISLYAYMNNNGGVCPDLAKNMYVAEKNNNRIRKIIQLTHKPIFAFGEGQFITPCAGFSYPVDSLLWVADLDSGQTETWTIISPPSQGTVTGFPATRTSVGRYETVKPMGLSYLPLSTYTGADSFRVRVSDGILSDTITVYASVQMISPGVISGTSTVCQGLTIPLVETVPGGIWSTTNPRATIGPLTGVITGVTAGVDTVVYTVMGSCTVFTTKVITVNPSPYAGTIVGDDSMCIGTTIIFTDTASGGTWSSANTNASVSGSGFVTGLLRGIDTIKYSVTNICGTAVAAKVIVIDSFPVAGVIAGADSVCEADTIRLSNAVSPGIWGVSHGNVSVSGSGIVTGINPGIDIISYSVINTCGTAMTSKTVIIKPLPYVGPIVCDSVVCVHETIALTNSVPGGSWARTNDHGVFTGPSGFIGITPGKDTLFYTVHNACGGRFVAKEITIIDCPNSGFPGSFPGPAINIFPNPASSALHIEWNTLSINNAVISLRDVTGRIVLTEELVNSANGGGSRTIDIAVLRDGVYLVTIRDNELYYTAKVVISK